MTVKVSEDAKPSTFLFRFEAMDKDFSPRNNRVRYHILGLNPDDLLTLDSASGELYLKNLLDRETTSEYSKHITYYTDSAN